MKKMLIAAAACFLSAAVAQTLDDPAISAGKRIYDENCQGCHGGNGTGGGRAPSLASGVFRHGSTDIEISQNIHLGLPGTQMPAFGQLSAEELRYLLAYIRSVSTPTGGSGETFQGSAAAGEAIFFGKADCASCHQINARGGIVGPDLSNVGRLPGAALRQKIVEPNTAIGGGGRGGAPAPATLIARTKSGQEIRGI